MFNTKLKLELIENRLRLEAETEKVAAATSKLEQAAAVMRSNMERISEQDAKIVELERELFDVKMENRQLDKDKAVLMERLDLMANYGIGRAAPAESMHVSEEYEDAKHALDAGLIDQSQFEKLLEAAGFQNNEVEVYPADAFPQV